MVRAAIVNLKTAEERRTLRRRLGPLAHNLVRPSTLNRYAACFQQFVDHLRSLTHIWPASKEEYDSIVSDYLELLWDAGEPRSSGAYALASIQFYIPQLRKHLPRSWKLKAIWDKLELPAQAVPLSLEHTIAISGYFAKGGNWRVSLGILVCFNAMLRTGELLHLRVGDVIFSQDCCVLHLGETKGAKRNLLQDETVVLSDPLTLSCLRAMVAHQAPGNYLLQISPSSFRTEWNKMKVFFKLTPFRILPYSLRRGGATWYHSQTNNFHKTMQKGRWEHLKTCRLYIADAQLALSQVLLPQECLAKLDNYYNIFWPQLVNWCSQGRVEGIRRD